MQIKFSHFRFIFIVLAILCVNPTYGQRNKRKQLEAKRVRLQKEMNQLNKLLFSSRKKTHSVYTQVVNMNKKISLRNKLIHSYNDEINELTKLIDSNKDTLQSLNKDTKELKTQYGAMLRQAQKNNTNNNSFFMFILASDNISQAYNRMQYIKQYNDFRKKQLTAIRVKTDKLTLINDSLKVQVASKKELITANETQKEAIAQDKKTQDSLYKKLKSKEQEVKAKLAKARKKRREIDRAIAREIAKVVKKSSGGKKFKLSTAGKKLASSFKASYGKMPWPVAKGIVLRYFGKQPHPLERNTTIDVSGVEIATSKNANARAVFKGTVLAVMVVKGGNKAVLIKHGNYITVYSNLSKVFVRKGDTINAKEDLGEIFYNRHTDKTVLMFQIWNNTTKLNPAPWIHNL